MPTIHTLLSAVLTSALLLAPAPSSAQVAQDRLLNGCVLEARWVDRDLVHPRALVFLPNGDRLITERGGRLWLINGDAGDGQTGTRRAVTGVPAVVDQGQGRLLGCGP